MDSLALDLVVSEVDPDQVQMFPLSFHSPFLTLLMTDDLITKMLKIVVREPIDQFSTSAFHYSLEENIAACHASEIVGLAKTQKAPA